MWTAAQPRANYVTTTRKMAQRRYHYVAGAMMIWRRSADGTRVPDRMVTHTLCRNWISRTSLVDDAPAGQVCDLCMLHQSRVWAAQPKPVDF